MLSLHCHNYVLCGAFCEAFRRERSRLLQHSAARTPDSNPRYHVKSDETQQAHIAMGRWGSIQPRLMYRRLRNCTREQLCVQNLSDAEQKETGRLFCFGTGYVATALAWTLRDTNWY